MTVYVLGAGASVHAGYPLASGMAEGLLGWMDRPVHDLGTYAGRYPAVAKYLRESFQSVANIEVLVAGIREQIRELQGGARRNNAPCERRWPAPTAFCRMQCANGSGKFSAGPR